MSFEFSRRDFLKYTAVAAVAVAGAGLFTGCKSGGDSYNPMSAGAGSLKVLSITGEMGTYNESDKKYVQPDMTGTTITFPMKITNGRTNPISINPYNFKAVVEDENDNVLAKYNYSNGLSVDSALCDTNLLKNASVQGNITLKLSSALKEGQSVVLTYCPDLAYNEYTMNWRAAR